MMQAVRSATNQRRQESTWGPRDEMEPGGGRLSLGDFAAHANNHQDSGGPPELIRQPSRFRETILQAEELSIRRLRVAETAKGGWSLRIFGIGRSFGGLPGSKLIHPHSMFSSCVLCCSGTCRLVLAYVDAWGWCKRHESLCLHIVRFEPALLLLYSALASAFLVGFLWLSEACDEPPPTLHFDVFVDIFFLLEIFMNFVTGVYVNGEYTDDIRRVAKHYVGGGFVFDLATSIPVSFVEIAIARQCEEMSVSGASMDGMSADSNILRIIRTSKALRVARLLRAFKIVARLKSLMGFVSFVGDYLRIPPYVLRISKIGLLLAMLVHICTCAYWLIKTTSNDEAVFHEFLDMEMLSHHPREDLASKYVLAFYFVNTVFCTIGFGDVAGTNNAERLFCVVLFYLGVFVFGSLLVEVQDAIQKAGIDRRDREQELNNMVSFLRAEDVPRQLERHMVKWADFGMREQQRYQSRNKVLGMVPSHLHRQLMHALHQGLLTSVPIFTHMDNMFKEDLLLDLWETMRPRVYSAFVPIAAAGNKQAELFVISAGTVILQRGKDVLSTLKKGDSFGESWLLLGDKANAQKSAQLDRYVSVTDVSCMVLQKAKFETVLSRYDASVHEYFDMCRSRFEDDWEQVTLELPDSDSDAGIQEQVEQIEQNGSTAARAGTITDARDTSHGGVLHSLGRTPSALSHVSRARWINLVKKAYNKLYLTDHALGPEETHFEVVSSSLQFPFEPSTVSIAACVANTECDTCIQARLQLWKRAASRYRAISHPISSIERSQSSGSAAAEIDSQSPRRIPRTRFGSANEFQRGQSATQELSCNAVTVPSDFKVDMQRLLDMMATVCSRLETLESQHLKLHRCLLPTTDLTVPQSSGGLAVGMERCDTDWVGMQGPEEGEVRVACRPTIAGEAARRGNRDVAEAMDSALEGSADLAFSESAQA